MSWLAVLLPLVMCGCYSAKISEPQRTAIEQLLLSRASDEAMQDVDLTWLKGKKIFVEEKYFESIDKGYAISLIRQCLSQSGALLMKTNDEADAIVEIRSGGLGMSTSETLFGIPALTIPIPLSGPAQTPEIAFYKSQKADSIGKFALFAYVRKTGEPMQASGPNSGYAHFYLFKVFGITWIRTNVPQLQKNAAKDQEMRDKQPKWPTTNAPSAASPTPQTGAH